MRSYKHLLLNRKVQCLRLCGEVLRIDTVVNPVHSAEKKDKGVR